MRSNHRHHMHGTWCQRGRPAGDNKNQTIFCLDSSIELCLPGVVTVGSNNIINFPDYLPWFENGQIARWGWPSFHLLFGFSQLSGRIPLFVRPKTDVVCSLSYDKLKYLFDDTNKWEIKLAHRRTWKCCHHLKQTKMFSYRFFWKGTLFLSPCWLPEINAHYEWDNRKFDHRSFLLTLEKSRRCDTSEKVSYEIKSMFVRKSTCSLFSSNIRK